MSVTALFTRMRPAAALLGLASLAAGFGAPAPALAADAYPSHPITLIIPFATGGFTDVVARVISAGLSQALGQPVVLDNRPGAGSTLGADLVAKAPADGYKLLFISTTHVISASLYNKLPYDPIKSFTPIGKVAEAPYVLVTNAQVPVKSVADLIALAKSEPGKLDFASSGNGSSQHMMAALFNSMAGIKANHVPYRGSGQAAIDLAGGTVQYGFMGTPVAIQQSAAGRMRALAVTSAKRSSQLPNTPTLDESGLKGYNASVWLALLAPAGTPPAIVKKLQVETAKVMNAPETKAALAAAGVEPSVSDGPALAKLMQSDEAKWAKVVKETGAKIE